MSEVLTAHRVVRRRGPVVSFSGIDGAGKTTLALVAAEELRRLGYPVRIIRIYPFPFGTILRLVIKILFPWSASTRKQNTLAKNSSPFHSFVKRLFFKVNCFYLGYALRIFSNRGAAVICDRYLYDQLANLSAEGSVTELKYKAFMALIPRPDAAFLLRASKEIICKRRENSDSCEVLELTKAYLKIAGSGEFWVVDTDDGTKCRGEVRGILSYASKSW